MKEPSSPARQRRRVAVDAAMVFIVVILMTQMWLLTATLELYLAGHTGVSLPGFIVSLVLFGVCCGLYRLVVRLDRLPEPGARQIDAGPWRIG